MTQENTITDPIQRARWCKHLVINVQPGISSCPHLLKCDGCEEFEDVRPPDQRHSPTDLEDEIADWIDTRNIAALIINTLKENEIEVSLQTAKDLWLSCCTSLWDFMQDRV